MDEQNLCSSASCKNKKKIVVPVVASVLSALVPSVALCYEDYEGNGNQVILKFVIRILVQV